MGIMSRIGVIYSLPIYYFLTVEFNKIKEKIKSKGLGLFQCSLEANCQVRGEGVC